MKLSRDQKVQFALAILLWKDFKSQGQMDIEVTKQAISMTKYIDCYEEFEKLLGKVPVFKITH